MRLNLICLALSIFAVGICQTQASSFLGLGDVVGGDFFSNAQGISGDGLTVVGQSTGNVNTSFIWTATGGMKALYNTNTIGIAYKTSSNGIMIVGRDDGNGARAFRINAGASSPTLLGGLNPGGSPANQGRSWSVSGDATVVVGSVASPASTGGEQAFRFSISGTSGMVPMGFLGSSNGNGISYYSEAHDVSSNGSVIVGFSSSNAGQSAFRYTVAGGMQDLGRFAGDTSRYSATAISGDGNVIVGSTLGGKAFTWTQAGGMVALSGFTNSAKPMDVNLDGSVIVGSDKLLPTDLNTSAVFWLNGVEFGLKTFLLAQGNTALANWSLSFATGISDDGLKICGTGIDPAGNTEAFIANISVVPEPSTNALMLIGVLSIATLVVRRRRIIAA